MAGTLRHAVLLAFCLVTPIRAAVLEVGDKLPFTRIEAALDRARDGDVILVHPKPDHSAYEKTALLVRVPRITIRSADFNATVTLDGQGFDYSGKGPIPRAIIQLDPSASGCVIDGLELTGAHNESCNGAGIRINQANDVTIRRCNIHGNDIGIMSNGSLAERSAENQLIEGCHITDNGNPREAGYNHNLYLGGTSVTVRACEIARSITGHNLKSRAHFNLIEYNYIHDSANRELDLVDAKGNTSAPQSHAIVLGNTIVKKKAMHGNKAVIHFGQDQKGDHAGTLYLVHNTIVTPYISPVVDLSAANAGASLLNNEFSDAGAKQKGVLVSCRDGAQIENVSGMGNLVAEGFGEQMPVSIGRDKVWPWDQLEIPWPGGKRPELREWVEVGKLRVRKNVTAGAGNLPVPTSDGAKPQAVKK